MFSSTSVAKNIEEHYKCEKTRFTVLSNRFIGAQAIKMAKHGLRAVDVLKYEGESKLQKFRWGAAYYFQFIWELFFWK